MIAGFYLQREGGRPNKVPSSVTAPLILKGVNMGPVLSNIFTNDLDNGAECTLSTFAEDTKLGRVADRQDGCAAIRRDLDGLGKFAKNLTKFNKGKCKVL